MQAWRTRLAWICYPCVPCRSLSAIVLGREIWQKILEGILQDLLIRQNKGLKHLRQFRSVFSVRNLVTQHKYYVPTSLCRRATLRIWVWSFRSRSYVSKNFKTHGMSCSVARNYTLTAPDELPWDKQYPFQGKLPTSTWTWGMRYGKRREEPSILMKQNSLPRNSDPQPHPPKI